MRKYWPVLLLGLIILLVIAGNLLKDNLNDYLSKKMREPAGSEVSVTGEMWVDSLFNYKENGEGYEYTLLQFKSGGCAICKRMEPELEKIRRSSGDRVNVVVLNIMNQNSVNVMKYFGISAVPTQLLLDKSGTEVFRNYGFISARDLNRKMVNQK